MINFGPIWILAVITCYQILGYGEGVTPPTSTSTCTGVIGFSSVGISKVNPSGIIIFSNNIYTSNIDNGWNREIGVFTAKCSGIYTISFTMHGNTDARFIFKKRRINTRDWDSYLTTLGGESQTILMQLSSQEQVALHVGNNFDGVVRQLQLQRNSSFSMHLIKP